MSNICPCCLILVTRKHSTIFNISWSLCIFILQKAKTYKKNSEKPRFQWAKPVRKGCFGSNRWADFGWLHKIFSFSENPRICYHLCHKMAFIVAKISVFALVSAFFFANSPKTADFYCRSLCLVLRTRGRGWTG